MADRIAVVGYSCRLPGHVSTAEDLWELCTRGRTGWSEVPAKRFSSDAFYHPNPLKPGSYNPKGGYFLQHDISKFDAPFFNLTEKEAISMDPQQRLLLECTFEALENAGIPKESLAGRQVAVYVGGNFADYELMNMRDVETAPMYQATGGASAMQANRLSHFFDFKGPSLTIDTACSGSLVALHHAVRSLATGESTEAIVAGCRLNILPDYFITMSMSQLLNDHGKTFAFDERADGGFAKGEGAGVIVLKPLAAALRDGDAIRAVITSTGVSQDGRTLGITNPNGTAQAELIKKVYQDAKIDPRDCGFAEMHGTGTKVGDPIEAEAVHQALSHLRTPKDPLYIGSLKSNVGHLEGASGVVSVIKACLMLQKKLVLPNANFRSPNPSIPMTDWNMKVLKSTRPWPGKKKYVSVSNYGFGGTNAHAVLEMAPYLEKQHRRALGRKDHTQKLFAISASDRDALQARTKDLGIYFEQRPEVFEHDHYANVAYTLGCRRSHLTYRLAIIASSLDECGSKLAQGKVVASRSLSEPLVGFVFTGQGAQWAQMGMALMEEFPVFQATILRADEHLRTLNAKFSLLEELRRPKKTSRINAPEISQPACTAVQVGLVNLLRSWGISPTSVVGHSSGEIAAAYAVGAFSADNAVALAYHRGLMTLKLRELHPELAGGMIAVGLGIDAVQPFLDMIKTGYLTVACVNSPTSVTVSGDKVAIEALHNILDGKDIFNRSLPIDVAYHSQHMARVSNLYLASISSLLPASQLSGQMFSSVNGHKIDASTLGPSYWVSNLVSPVLFSGACASMCSDSQKPDLLIEIGPHCALKGPIRDIMAAQKISSDQIRYSPTLLRNENDVSSALSTAGAAFCVGVAVGMLEINFPHSQGQSCSLLTDIPRYPWRHDASYWHEARIPNCHKTRSGRRNDILGLLAEYSNDLEPTWRNIIRLDDVPWLRHHKMQGMPVFPFSGYLSMAVEAMKCWSLSQSRSFDSFELRDVVVSSAMVLSDDVDTESTISLRPQSDSTAGYSNVWKTFVICSWNPSRGWMEHCRGLVRAEDQSKQLKSSSTEMTHETDAERLRKREEVIDAKATQMVDETKLYQILEEVGASYGQTFRGLTSCSSGAEHCRGEIIVPDTASLMPKTWESQLTVHPALLDEFLQLTWPILGATTSQFETLYMPTTVRSVKIQANIASIPGEKLRVWCTGSPDLLAPKPTTFEIHALQGTNTNRAAIQFAGFVMTPVQDGAARKAEGRKMCCKLVSQPFTQQDQVDSPVRADSVVETPKDRPYPIGLPSDCVVLSFGEDESLSASVTSIIAAAGGSQSMRSTPERDPLAMSEDAEPPTKRRKIDRMTDSPSTSSPSPSEGLHSPNIVTGRLGEPNTAGRSVVLLQSPSKTLQSMTHDEFEDLKQVLLGCSQVLWVYARDVPEASMSVGLARTIRTENMSKIYMLGLLSSELESPAAYQAIAKVIHHLWAPPTQQSAKDMEFSASGGVLTVQRVIEDTTLNDFVSNELGGSSRRRQAFTQPGRRLKIDIGSKGALDTLHFVDDEAGSLDDESIEIEVRATGVNFKDIVVCMGQVNQPYIGVECSGVVSAVGKNVTHLQKGQRVMAMTTGAYSTYARCLATSAFPINDEMGFEEAATIPVVFCTAYYGLFDTARLTAGESILIHAAAGGVGQAAIMLARSVGADIYATVGSDEKKRFLMDRYGLPEERIFCSRDTRFNAAIRHATAGSGVDVVLNSLAGEMLKESWDCLAPFGRFVEIGKADITRNARLDMLKFEYNCTFSSVDLTKVAAYKPKLMRRLLSDVHELMTKKTISPIAPIKVYPISETEAAFRALQSGRTVGKLVVVPEEHSQVMATVAKVPSKIFSSNATYIIIGGAGGLGRSMAKWMSSKGARIIVLTSRNASKNTRVSELAKELSANGTKIVVRSCDVAARESVKQLIAEVRETLPPIRGIINAAMYLKDTLFEQMSLQDFNSVTACKVDGTQNLHECLENHQLEFFIALSSVAGIVGNRGQAAYSAANVFLDSFMQWRRSKGLPGTSIDLAAVSDVGYLADGGAARREEVLKGLGGQTVNESEVLALIAAAVTGKMQETCSGQCITGLGDATSDSFWLDDARFALLKENIEGRDDGGGSAGAANIPLLALVRKATSRDSAHGVLLEALAKKITAVLALPDDTIEPTQTLKALGLDSLVAIEIRNWIVRETEVNMQVLELLSSGSINGLTDVILKKMGV